MDYDITQQHADLVERLCKPGAQILRDMTYGAAHALHMAVGVAGEAGELLDCVKKHAIYGKPLDTENLIEELGDIEFYMEGLRRQYGISRERVLEHNVRKLSKRYSSGAYSNAEAQARADKEGA